LIFECIGYGFNGLGCPCTCRGTPTRAGSPCYNVGYVGYGVLGYPGYPGRTLRPSGSAFQPELAAYLQSVVPVVGPEKVEG
jgi:hypothetical protein